MERRGLDREVWPNRAFMVNMEVAFGNDFIEHCSQQCKLLPFYSSQSECKVKTLE